MRIAICDDEEAYCRSIAEMLQTYKLTKPDFTFSLSVFSSGKELLNQIEESGGFDLYLLDIIMPNLDGIQLGHMLRDRGDTGMIVFLTSSSEFAVESYHIEAFHYLLKPIIDKQLFPVLDKAVTYFRQAMREVISIKTPDSIRMLPVRDIRYAERNGRVISYYMSNDTSINSVSFNDTFKNAAAPMLIHNGLILVGSSYVVNLYHVTEVTRSDLIISDKIHIPVPRRMYETVKSQWADYWLNGGNCHVI